MLGRLPVSWGEALGAVLGRLAYRLGWRRAVVESQISRSFPQAEPAWVREVARAAFEHVGREAVALAALSRRDPESIPQCVPEFEGLDALRAAVQVGRGVVVVTGHFGNWEFAAAAVAAYGLPIDAVMQGLANPYLTRYVRRVRERLGIGLIDRASAWGRLRESLARGHVVAFVADQDARDRGVFVPFFGRPASTHRAPALLALRTGAPLFVGFAVRVAPRRYRLWTTRIEPPASGDVQDRVRALTRRWTEELERRIRLSPGQYFWHHRRWKTRPRGTVPEAAGIRDGKTDM